MTKKQISGSEDPKAPTLSFSDDAVLGSSDDEVESEKLLKCVESEKSFRRFGCLCYFIEEPRDKIPKIQPRWTKGVFSGFLQG